MLYELPAFPWLRQEGRTSRSILGHITQQCLKNPWAGGMAEWLRECTALTDDMSSGLSIEYLVTAYNPTSRESL